jgi:hypothetical protein
MSNQSSNSGGPNLPIAACIAMALATGLVSGASFEIIKVWPLPVSVVPALDFSQGFLWGVVVGGISGLIIGFVTDDNNYPSVES